MHIAFRFDCVVALPLAGVIYYFRFVAERRS